MRKYIVAALLAGSLAAPAMAQDAPAAPFTGVRVEGLVGWDRNQVPNAHSDGVAYGVGLGYDFQAGNMVVGIEGEAADSTADECTSGVVRTGDSLCGEAGRDLYVGGRLGTRVGASTLLYAKAGYSNARLRIAYDANLAGTTGDFVTRSNYDGIRVGAGVEQKIGTNAFVKAEYRYTNYDSDLEKHQALVGFGFRF
ncbi:MAG: porin family protein [Alphaproteobacteria bacterium]|nr:porin family protein [Alphaproteobacteria bacterium]MBV9371904.1 porin family protein [Alphaproteobacteria bacterium]MBV9902290.1 porin family protein [Alphaproteobacteria bacterium]